MGTLVSQSRPRRAASTFHSSLYPLPSKWIALHSLIYPRITSRIAETFGSPFSIRASTSFLNFISCSATAEFNAIMALAQLASEPTARNSNRFPVKAKGEVRLRSVLSISNSGIWGISSFIPCFPLRLIRSSLVLFSI